MHYADYMIDSFAVDTFEDGYWLSRIVAEELRFASDEEVEELCIGLTRDATPYSPYCTFGAACLTEIRLLYTACVSYLRGSRMTRARLASLAEQAGEAILAIHDSIVETPLREGHFYSA